MILIFDLDDTLYPELEYVRSGFLAVANELNHLFKWPVTESFNFMLKTLDEKGRGAVFNDLLHYHQILKYRPNFYQVYQAFYEEFPLKLVEYRHIKLKLFYVILNLD